MLVSEFIAKWKKVDLKERSAAQEHFIDLCRLVGHPTPAQADPTGASYCFERGAAKYGGGDGFADVWKKGFFGWEYKGKHKDLVAAYDQLLRYRDALASPPLLVVCDLDRIIVHTNFTNTASAAYEIGLDQLGEPRNLEVLRNVFFDPKKLRPGQTSEAITQKAAQHFASIAESMRGRGLESGHVAHFLDRVVFCLFAEDIGLLPDLIFSRIVEKSAGEPVRFCRLLGQLFEAMEKGGEFGVESIRHFNGSLFDNATVPELTAQQVQGIAEATRLDWSAIDPSIFGTLFERGLDPSKRSQLGAHFTSRDDIEILVDAVVMQPLLREWSESQQIVESLLTTGRRKASTGTSKPVSAAVRTKARAEADGVIQQFLARLQNVKVLDPACGSGNFLYVALQRLKDLEKAVTIYSQGQGLGSFLPLVGPWQLYGIEINPYAHDLAQMTVWIGWLQWIRFNGFGSPQEPILRPMEGNFQRRDAILDLTDPANPKEPDWPEVDFIVGNPPFLGTKKLRSELGDEYVERLFAFYGDRIPNFSDLCCYWFEKARAHIVAGKCQRAGLLATQGIRGGLNREVLKRVKESGEIFWAISDREWVLDGANVHVSVVAFDGGKEESRTLDGVAVSRINANLTAAADTVSARRLSENMDRAFIADVKAGKFDVQEEEALSLLRSPNAHGRPNSDVLLPWINSLDVLRRDRNMWIIDFGVAPAREEAELYEEPFRIVRERVYPERAKVKRKRYRELWWLHAEPCDEMRRAVAAHTRYLVTPTVAKHRVFVWWAGPTLPDHQLVAFGGADCCLFGVLQSHIHEVWALAQGTQLREKESGFRYTPTSCLATFPLPVPAAAQEASIANAAQRLQELRAGWLNPPEWTHEDVLEFPGTVGGPWDRYIDKTTVDGKTGIGLVRYPRLVPKDASSANQLQKRTLTQLYNARPAWLETAHRNLDVAVFAAYGWDPDMPDDDLLGRLLGLNLARSAAAGT